MKVPPRFADALLRAANKEGVVVSLFIRRACVDRMRAHGIEPPDADYGEKQPKPEKPKRPRGRPRKA